jgi:hypothetical protein
VPIGLLIGAIGAFALQLRAEAVEGAQGGYVVTGSPILNEVPACPRCGGEMIERTATRGQFVGKPFWGCRKYPRCRGVACMS